MILVEAYSPGLWEQDIYTLPIEAGLVHAVTHFYTPVARPLWPFQNETTTGVRNPTRHSGRLLAPIGGSIAALSIGSLLYTSDTFAFGPVVRGWIHAHLLTELATSFAKVTFQRKRPHHDSEKANGTLRKDDRFSFWSGHASHAFAFATYSSSMMREYAHPVVGWTFTGFSYGLAAFVGGTRAHDGQHNWTDVIAGATAGTLITQLVYNRTSDVIQFRQKEADADACGSACTKVTFKPLFTTTGSANMEKARPIYGLKVEANF